MNSFNSIFGNDNDVWGGLILVSRSQSHIGQFWIHCNTLHHSIKQGILKAHFGLAYHISCKCPWSGGPNEQLNRGRSGDEILDG